MANPAALADVEEVWRPLSVSDRTVAQSLLDRAWTVLLLRVPRIEERMAASTVLADRARQVVVDATIRVLKNPDGWKQQSAGPFQGTRDASVATGLLYVTDSEVADLSVVSTAPRVGTIYVRPGY